MTMADPDPKFEVAKTGGTGEASKPASHKHLFNTRNKITNYTHFCPRFRAIQTCSYT